MTSSHYGQSAFDLSGMRWQLPDGPLDFEWIPVEDPLDQSPSPLLEAFQAFLRVVWKDSGASTIRSYHHIIGKSLRSEEIRSAILTGRDDVLSICAKEYRQRWNMEADTSILQHLTLMKRWYVWSSVRHEAFDADVATVLEGVRIGNARLGTAVLRRDAGCGPLSRSESAMLEKALWDEVVATRMPLPRLAAVLLMKHLGFNPENLRRMNEEDLKKEIVEDEFRILMVPRIKKGSLDTRDQLLRREIAPRIAGVLEQVVAENAHHHPPNADDGRMGRPMFWDERADGDRRRAPQNWFADAVSDVAESTGLEDDFGEPLRLFPRRLRYTFAKERVDEGMSAANLRALLDHCSDNVLLVYYDARLDVVERLDAALGARIARFAEVAMKASPKPASQEPFEPALNEIPRKCLTCHLWHPTNAKEIERQADELEQEAGERAAIGACDTATLSVLRRCTLSTAAARRAAAHRSLHPGICA